MPAAAASISGMTAPLRDEVIAIGGRRFVLVGSQRVVDHTRSPVAAARSTARNSACCSRICSKRGRDLVVSDGLRRVLHLDTFVVAELDGGA